MNHDRPNAEASIGESTIEDLVNELLYRMPAAVVAGCVPDEDGKDSTSAVVWGAGNKVTQLGLAVMLNRYMENSILIEEDEE